MDGRRFARTSSGERNPPERLNIASTPSFVIELLPANFKVRRNEPPSKIDHLLVYDISKRRLFLRLFLILLEITIWRVDFAFLAVTFFCRVEITLYFPLGRILQEITAR
jgi:hypothetical protein